MPNDFKQLIPCVILQGDSEGTDHGDHQTQADYRQ